MAELQWWLADLRTGDVLDRLRAEAGDLEHVIARSSSVTATVAAAALPASWHELADPATAMIVPVMVAGRHSVPLTGYLLSVDAYGAEQIPLTLTSLEVLLEEAEIVDLDVNQDESMVAAQLVGQTVAPDFGFELDVTTTGRIADRTYTTEERRKLGEELNALMAADGGPEWTVRVLWRDADQSGFRKVVVIGPRVGADLPDVIVREGALSGRTRTRDASGGRLAQIVTVASDADAVTVEAGPLLDAGQPPRRVTLQVDVPDDEADPDAFLLRYATKAARVRSTGVTTWAVELDARHPACPRLGVDFLAGDAIAVDLGPWGRRHNEDTGRDYWLDPKEWRGTARLSGWRASVQAGELVTVTPQLYDDREDVG